MSELESASSLLTRLGSQTPYVRLVELFQSLESAAQKGSAARRAARMNGAARALASLAVSVPEQVRADALRDLGGTAAYGEVIAALEEECSRPAVRLFSALLALPKGPFLADGERVINDPESLSLLAEQGVPVAEDTSILDALYGGVLVMQRLIARQLLVYRSRIEDAALLLRRMAAEVADGEPTLMRADELDPSTGTLDIRSPTLKPIPLDRGVLLHRAIDHGRQLLRDTEGLGSLTVHDNANAMRDDVPVTSGESERRDAEPAAAHNDDSTHEPSLDDAALATDLGALARHATELTDDLERAWSHALDPAALGEAFADLDARLSSLVVAIQRQIEVVDHDLRDSGLDPRLRAFPLRAEDIADLSFAGSHQQRVSQLRQAELEAFTSVLDNIGAVRNPAARRVDLGTGESESWWVAGAFDLLRARIRHLVRVSAAVERAVANPDTPGGPPGLADVDHRLRLASRALSAGDPEASLLHVRLALHERVAVLVGDAPPDLLERLESAMPREDQVTVLRLLREAVTAEAAGRPLDIGVVALLAPRVLKLVAELCFYRPEILAQVFGSDAQ
jgi:hypothetical protein